ncbi:MAG: ABC transporter substrate-binding protein [Bacteroidota bacterium]
MLRSTFRLFGLAALAVAFALPVLTPTALAQDAATIKQMLQDRDTEIKAILGTGTSYTDAQRERLRTVVNDVIDFRAMGAYALGDTWDTLTEEQRSRFVDAFSGTVRRQSLARLDIYQATVSYGEVAVDGTTATATTTTTYRDTRAEVVYDLAKSNGEWLVTDITIDGVGTAGPYRRSFQRMIARRGYDALVSSLERTLARE